jgi:hypothetical protein
VTAARARSLGAVVGAGALSLVLGLPLAACSSSGDDATEPVSTSSLVPSSTGDSCTDVIGDLDLPAGVAADTPGITGIDIVSADAAVVGDQLEITMTMAGPIDSAPAATYVVAQGDPLGSLSFEVRMVHGTDGWSTMSITWPGEVEERRQIPVTPTVTGVELTASIPLASLPPIALAMQFGAAATVGDALVIDSCSSLDPG